MKLFYRGGLNKYDPQGYQKSYFYEYAATIKQMLVEGKRVCFVTLAKPDGYYDAHILPQFGQQVDIIGNRTPAITWSRYDLIFLCGGDTLVLKEGLVRKQFDLSTLQEHVVILGDSAGAMLLSPYFYDTHDGRNSTFLEGIFPQTKTMVISHANNPRYCTPELVEQVEEFAAEKQLRLLTLAENETKLFDEATNTFVKVVFQEAVNNPSSLSVAV